MTEGGAWDTHAGLDVSNRGAIARTLNDESENGKADGISQCLEAARIQFDLGRHDHLSLPFWLFRECRQDVVEVPARSPLASSGTSKDSRNREMAWRSNVVLSFTTPVHRFHPFDPTSDRTPRAITHYSFAPPLKVTFPPISKPLRACRSNACRRQSDLLGWE